MKLIQAIVRPEKLEDIQRELRPVLDEGDKYRITVDNVEGHGQQMGDVQYVRGQAVRPRLVPKLRITIAVNDRYVEPAIQAIIKGARSSAAGEVGDGKIFVLPLEDCIRIRTGERGGAAI
jgi:nitrogen regulatory protein P-II 1